MLTLGWDLASCLPDVCHIGHIFWAVGWKPGYLPAFLALCTHDLILALQPPTGQEALPHSADEEKEAHEDGCLTLGGHPAWARVGPRLQWGRWNVVIETMSHCPFRL